MIRSPLRRRRAAWSLPVPDACAPGRHALATPHLLIYTPVPQLDALAALAASADPDAQRWHGNQTDQLVPDPDTRHALLGMGPAGAIPRWFTKANPNLAEPFTPSPETFEFMVCVHRQSGRYAGHLELHPDRNELGGTLAPDHRGQGLGAELFLAGAELAHRVHVYETLSTPPPRPLSVDHEAAGSPTTRSQANRVVDVLSDRTSETSRPETSCNEIKSLTRSVPASRTSACPPRHDSRPRPNTGRRGRGQPRA
ncbi:GNAT family N-acetyltransferase [Streptomyces sp. MNU76]|uniref:GNAT family N-acetyltransferase n=1 Tax=Streptomyces sp. MNU76 TaxID=2560026 RepID=UPI001E5F4A29|nr:GNAT family N-acetyltransferase [Streptomyces sp. MNU76]MCC9711504.1 GNAT family N-acetyltransferase [Streptomyces sp. MNU76]